MMTANDIARLRRSLVLGDLISFVIVDPTWQLHVEKASGVFLGEDTTRAHSDTSEHFKRGLIDVIFPLRYGSLHGAIKLEYHTARFICLFNGKLGSIAWSDVREIKCLRQIT